MVRSYKYSICLCGMCNFLHTKTFLTSLRWGLYKALCYMASQNEIWSEKNIILDINAFFCCLLMQQFRLSTFKSNLFVMGTLMHGDRIGRYAYQDQEH